MPKLYYGHVTGYGDFDAMEAQRLIGIDTLIRSCFDHKLTKVFLGELELRVTTKVWTFSTDVDLDRAVEVFYSMYNDLVDYDSSKSNDAFLVREEEYEQASSYDAATLATIGLPKESEREIEFGQWTTNNSDGEPDDVNLLLNHEVGPDQRRITEFFHS